MASTCCTFFSLRTAILYVSCSTDFGFGLGNFCELALSPLWYLWQGHKRILKPRNTSFRDKYYSKEIQATAR